MRLTGLMALNIPAWKINRIEVSIFLLSVNEFYDEYYREMGDVFSIHELFQSQEIKGSNISNGWLILVFFGSWSANLLPY